ncbi:glycoside hydrolase family 30, partial [Reticulomyxa filosa]
FFFFLEKKKKKKKKNGCNDGCFDMDINLQWNTNNLYIGSTVNWATMVLHWNLLLEPNGDPHNGGCDDCRGIVTLDTDDMSVTLNEEFYGLLHFGKFVQGKAPAHSLSQMLSTKWTYSIGASTCVDGTAVTYPSQNALNIVVKNFCNQVQNISVVVDTLSQSLFVDLLNVPVGLSTLFWQL